MIEGDNPFTVFYSYLLSQFASRSYNKSSVSNFLRAIQIVNDGQKIGQCFTWTSWSTCHKVSTLFWHRWDGNYNYIQRSAYGQSYLHYNWYRLHLDWCGILKTTFFQIATYVLAKVIVWRWKICKFAKGIWYVVSVYTDSISLSELGHLKIVYRSASGLDSLKKTSFWLTSSWFWNSSSSSSSSSSCSWFSVSPVSSLFAFLDFCFLAAEEFFLLLTMVWVVLKKSISFSNDFCCSAAPSISSTIVSSMSWSTDEGYKGWWMTVRKGQWTYSLWNYLTSIILISSLKRFLSNLAPPPSNRNKSILYAVQYSQSSSAVR